MQDIAELERRISAALARIDRGIEGLAAPADPGPDAGAEAEIARLSEALDEERMANVQLAERLRVVKSREVEARAALEAKLAEVTAELANLRAARAEEAAEVAAIIAALAPIVEEASTHA
jgi:chromosome segregation ATPase